MPIQVLHLIGSATSKWYFDLSLMYGRTCTGCDQLSKEFVHTSVVVFLNGKWGFPASLDDADMQKAENGAVDIGKAMERIQAASPAYDVIVPHMFCVEGLTRYRQLCDEMGIEVLGCSGETCAVAQDKFLTKALVKTVGVPVPKGELLRRHVHGKNITVTATELLKRQNVPFIVKPAKEDNSFGLSLVKEATVEAIAKALSSAFEYDDSILVEEYIAGRECRVAVLEMGDGDDLHFEYLPKIEYVLEDIRLQKHKYGTDASGKIQSDQNDPSKAFLQAKEAGARICPAQFDPEVNKRIDDLAKAAHVALGCKYYSLYDVRINEDGFPFMLEACLFCSFSPYSVLVSLADKSTKPELQPHPKIFEMLLRRAAKETEARRSAGNDSETPGTGCLKRRKVEVKEN